MKTFTAFLLAVWLMGAALTGRAQLSISLTPQVQNSAAGQTLVFGGTMTNTGSTLMFLNNIQFSITGNYLISGSNGFYANVPGILLPGASYTGEVFTMVLGSGAPPAGYSGTVTLQGGGSIFATTNLASTPFTILSPAVTIVATGSPAQEFGPVAGSFTVTRTGATGIGLAVAYGIGGSAVNGVDYQAIGGTATIAAGASSSLVTITPILEQQALGQRSVTLTVQSSPTYNQGAHLSDTVFIQDTPFNSWRLGNFGASANVGKTAPTADWSGGGVPNLVAFGLSINPKNPNRAMLPVVSIVSNYLTLSYAPSAAATDVSYTVQASTDLIHWSSSNVEPVSSPPPNTVAFRYAYPVSAAPEVFLRLLVTPLD